MSFAEIADERSGTFSHAVAVLVDKGFSADAANSVVKYLALGEDLPE